MPLDTCTHLGTKIGFFTKESVHKAYSESRVMGVQVRTQEGKDQEKEEEEEEGQDGQEEATLQEGSARVPG